MCYSGGAFCVCCGREYDNPGPTYVAGCGCTSNKCDDCLQHGCKFAIIECLKPPHEACT